MLQFYTWNEIWLFLWKNAILITGDQNYGLYLFEEKFLLRPQTSLPGHKWFCRRKINLPSHVHVTEIMQRDMTNVLRMAVPAGPIFAWNNVTERFPLDWRPVWDKASMILKLNSALVSHRQWKQPTIPYFPAIWRNAVRRLKSDKLLKLPVQHWYYILEPLFE